MWHPESQGGDASAEIFHLFDADSPCLPILGTLHLASSLDSSTEALGRVGQIEI